MSVRSRVGVLCWCCGRRGVSRWGGVWKAARRDREWERCVHVTVHLYLCLRMCACARARVCACVHVHVRMCIYACACVLRRHKKLVSFWRCAKQDAIWQGAGTGCEGHPGSIQPLRRSPQCVCPAAARPSWLHPPLLRAKPLCVCAVVCRACEEGSWSSWVQREPHALGSGGGLRRRASQGPPQRASAPCWA